MAFDQFTISAFDSLWFWGLMLLQWSVILLRPMGVHYDLIANPDKVDDLITLSRMQAKRWKAPVPVWGFILAGFVLGLLVTGALTYQIEIASALIFLLVPQAIVMILNQRTAQRLTFDTVESIRKPLMRLHVWTQIVGFFVICVASFVGAIWRMQLGG